MRRLFPRLKLYDSLLKNTPSKTPNHIETSQNYLALQINSLVSTQHNPLLKIFASRLKLIITQQNWTTIILQKGFSKNWLFVWFQVTIMDTQSMENREWSPFPKRAWLMCLTKSKKKTKKIHTQAFRRCSLLNTSTCTKFQGKLTKITLVEAPGNFFF